MVTECCWELAVDILNLIVSLLFGLPPLPIGLALKWLKKNILNLHTIALANTTKDDDKSAGASEF